MKYIIILLSLTWIFWAQAEGNFDSSCFRYVASLDTMSGITQVWVENTTDDTFFVTQDGNILPSRQLSTEKNPPLAYTSQDDIDIRVLDDSDPYTSIEIDPILFTQGNVSYTFDLGKVYDRWRLVPRIGYVTDRTVSVSISHDGSVYVPVAQTSLEDFDLRYLRITFSGTGIQNGITRFHTLNFFQKVQSRYLFSSSGWKVSIFRSYACQQGKYTDYLLRRPMLSFTSEIPQNTVNVAFESNSLYRDDTDADGIENLRDNCPLISNATQNDRNHDGIGDMCSDDDGDGRFGNDDNCPTVPNPDQKDVNINSIWDACEFDSDSDGISDSLDNAIHIKNPDQKDSDNDRIGDVMDNCPLYNPDQLDIDKNGRGDACDRDDEYRKNHDTDQDGILDFSDNCPKLSNSDQNDTDSDGVGNVCDNCMSLKNPDQADANNNDVGDSCEDIDNDTIIWWRDNCPTISNNEQTDRDNNGIWDACSDIDGDTVYDATDVCPTEYNPDQNDIDKDGVWDICDTKDNRFLESNKYAFMVLIAIFGLLFITAIIFLIRKL